MVFFAIFRGKAMVFDKWSAVTAAFAQGFSNFSAAEFRAQHAFQASKKGPGRFLEYSWDMHYIYNIYIGEL
jgi:hypothetical protein